MQILRSRLCRSDVYLTSNLNRKVLPEEQFDLKVRYKAKLVTRGGQGEAQSRY